MSDSVDSPNGFLHALAHVHSETYDLGEAVLDLFHSPQLSPIALLVLGRTYRCVLNPLTKKVEIEELFTRRAP